MRKALLGAVIVATVASLANAAQVQLFLASPQSTNLATSGAGAYAAQQNPVLPAGPGSATIELWMALNGAELGPIGILGATNLGVMGAGSAIGSAAGPMPVNNPASRWPANAPGAANVGPMVWDGLGFLRSGGLPLSPDDAGNVIGGIALFRIGTGTINYGGADGSMFIALGGGSGIVASNDATGTAGLAFGWADVGGIDLSSFTQDNGGGAGPNPNFDDNNPQFGWIGAALGGAPVVSLVPDLTILPEPTTLALLGVAGLFIRRRR